MSNPRGPGPMNVQQALDAAMALHRAGRLADAEALYRQVLSAMPGNADALHLLGVAALQSGRLGEAESLIGRAVAIDRAQPSAHNNLGNVYVRQRRYDDAQAAFEAAIALQPSYADARLNLANLLRTRGRLREAIGHYRLAVAANPRAIGPRLDLATSLLGTGEPAAALSEFDAVARKHAGTSPMPEEIVKAHLGIAAALRDLGRPADAEAHVRALLAREPRAAGAWIVQSAFCLDRNDADGAADALSRAADAQPDNAETHYQLGNVLLTRRLDAREAIACYERALAVDPSHAAARWAWTIAQVPPLCESAEEAARSRDAFARALDALDRALPDANAVDGTRLVGSIQPFCLAYQEADNRDLLARYGALCVRLMQPVQRSIPAVHGAARGGRIRLGIASAQVRDHSVWTAIVRGWLAHLDRSRFDVHVFALGTTADAETERVRETATRFESGRRAIGEWARAIADSALDVLIYPEVGMDPTTAALASLRLAPTQAATWGHPETTGLPTIDHFLSAHAFEPGSAESNYTETLVRLPNLGVCYEPLATVPADPGLDALGLAGAPPILCPGTPFKYLPQHDDVWVSIASRVAPAKLVFFRPPGGASTTVLERRLARRFADAGLRADDHVAFVDHLDRPRFFGLMQRASLVLDTIGFSGFNTAMQALEAGAAVVAHEGRFLRGRLASGLLRSIGLDELVATDAAAFADLAVALASDGARRHAAREAIAARRGALFGDVEPVRALERYLASAAHR